MNDEKDALHNENNRAMTRPEPSYAGSGKTGAPASASSSKAGTRFAVGVVLVYMLVSGYLLSDMRGRISVLEQTQVAGQQKADQRTSALESNLKTTADALASQVGMTQEDLAKKTAALQQSQRAAVSRLSEEQKQALNDVNTQVSSVKGDVDATKTEVATTKSGLDATNARLNSAIGDLGVQSGLIAHSRDELEMLKHRGDRTYHEFTLLRGKPPTRVSTVSLQLKKVDPKKNRFTLSVLADDKLVEKRDRNTEEPLQFYTGKDHHLLYEVVVFTVTKNEVTGYLSTPQQATQSASLPGGD
jgi:hypothetical protein